MLQSRIPRVKAVLVSGIPGSLFLTQAPPPALGRSWNITRLEAKACWHSFGHIRNNRSAADDGVSSVQLQAGSTGQQAEGVQVGDAAFGLAQPILVSRGGARGRGSAVTSRLHSWALQAVIWLSLGAWRW